MKKLAFILALAGMLVGCNKNTEVSTNESITREAETATEVQNESSTISQDVSNVESVTETNTEEAWIALIEKEVTEISFKNGEYTIIPTEQKESYIYGELKNDLRFYVQLIPKDYINDSIQFVRPETFQEYAKAVLSASTLPKDLQKKRGVFEINGYTFGHGIWLTRFDPSITLFQSSYYTTTPTYTLECTFFRSLCEEFKEEAPQYFDENGDWKQKMPSGETGDSEFAKKIVDGTIESETARELYKISEDFMKTIEIKTVE
ncbi:hypothetical protein [Treponema pedis]|uniref:hypothetical protein n=1 Tax=Treponema pedis TaxID=409322 RepID=UPI003D24A990